MQLSLRMQWKTGQQHLFWKYGHILYIDNSWTIQKLDRESIKYVPKINGIIGAAKGPQIATGQFQTMISLPGKFRQELFRNCLWSNICTTRKQGNDRDNQRAGVETPAVWRTPHRGIGVCTLGRSGHYWLRKSLGSMAGQHAVRWSWHHQFQIVV